MKQARFSVRWGGAIASVLAFSVSLGGAMAAGTPAGTILTTDVEVSYTDDGAQTVRATPASVTVGKQAGLGVSLPKPVDTVSGMAGYPCDLVNSGNFPNGFQVGLEHSANVFAFLVKDANSNGTWESSENQLVTAVPNLNPDEAYRCILLVQSLVSKPNGQTASVTVTTQTVDGPKATSSATFNAVFASKMGPRFIFQASEPLASSPVVQNGLVLVGSETGVVYAVYAKGDRAGTLAWRFPEQGNVGAPIRGRVAFDIHGYYVTANNGKAYHLDLQGRLLWESQAAPEGTAMEAMPIVTPAMLTLACGDGRMRRLDKTTGQVIATSRPMGDGALTTPAVPERGDMWFGASDGYLYNVNDESAFAVMAAMPMTERPLTATPFVDSRTGQVLSVTPEGEVYALRIRSNKAAWGPVALGAEVKGSPWVDSTTGIAYFAGMDSTLHAVRVSDGSKVAGYPARLADVGGFVSTPVVAPLPNGNATLFAATTAGRLYGVNVADPQRFVQFDVNEPDVQFRGSIALSGLTLDDVLVAAASNGKLYGFTVRDAVAPR